MTIEDLREQGVLLPEEEWGTHPLETTVREIPLLAAFVLAVAAQVAAYAGNGSLLTWGGVAVFLGCLAAITWMCDRAILRQRERFRRERRRFGGDGDGDGDGPTRGHREGPREADEGKEGG